MIKSIRKFFKQLLASPQYWKECGDKDFENLVEPEYIENDYDDYEY